MLFSHVKLLSFRAKAHLVFHWCLYKNNVLLTIFYLMYLVVFLSIFVIYFVFVLSSWISCCASKYFDWWDGIRISHVCTTKWACKTKWVLYRANRYHSGTVAYNFSFPLILLHIQSGVKWTIVMLELASTSKWNYYPLFNLAPLLQYRPRTLQHLNVCKLRTIW